MPYEATFDAVHTHTVPSWFHDAKLGIFVHWGLYSVPGWAPLTGKLGNMIATEGWAAWFRRNPYAEWYLNSIQIPDSPSSRHHIETYGPDFSYDDFVPLFNTASHKWNPDVWADLFRQTGARYVVLTTKHHDGFRLWPSRHPNPQKGIYHAARDLVGELTEAVRGAGMKMGLYYSGGLDWTFNETVIQDIADIFRGMPQTPEYVQYANGHWLELIERYKPSILWNDIAYPAAANLPKLFAHFYNTVMVKLFSTPGPGSRRKGERWTTHPCDLRNAGTRRYMRLFWGAAQGPDNHPLSSPPWRRQSVAVGRGAGVELAL